jgi:hypothetical protein
MKVLNVLLILLGTLAGTTLSLILRIFITDFPTSYAVLIVALSVALIVFLQNLKGKLLQTSIKTIRLAIPERVDEEAREGLIVFLPLYRKFGSQAKTEEENEKEINHALETLDYSSLGFENINATNFGHATLAIQTHLSKLRYCWLVTSKSQKRPDQSSQRFLEVYKKFLSERVIKGKEVTFLEPTPLDVDDDAGVCEQAGETMQKVFREARREYKLKPPQMIVDVTPGTKSMTVGAVLGALSKEKDVQVIVAEYEPFSDRPRNLLPVIIKYEPKLIPE